MIVNDATVERNEDGSFSARTRLYELIASFPAVGMAVLTAKWRKTGAVSMIRKYAIKDGRLVQTEAVAV